MALVGLEVRHVFLVVATFQNACLSRWRPSAILQKVWTAVPSAIAFCVARAIGATQEAHFISYCRLAKLLKLFEANGMVGSGGGIETHVQKPVAARAAGTARTLTRAFSTIFQLRLVPNLVSAASSAC
jgi:hypothetical protein